MTRYAMAIDLKRCFGCHTCEIACKVANNMPENLHYLRVRNVGGDFFDTCAGQFPDNTLSYLPMQCQHCSFPACQAVCPTGATKTDEETGVVYIDYDECIGCQACIEACPYEGVRTYLGDEPVFYLGMDVGEFDAPPHLQGTVEKCTFCRNLTSRGDVPACMQLCPGRARHWGDMDDPESEVAQLVASRPWHHEQEDAGTEPNIYYLD